MVESTAVKPKKRGRPATGRDPFIGIRLPREMITQIDEWSKRSGTETRSEAIRRLVELGLAGFQPTPRPSPKVASKASDLAGQQIDELGDPSATDEERQTRKRRLLRGPKEFRDIRGDLPKPKP
jgi:Arc/MetJ-type ribon-helix-helix transcriptional regulator